MSGLIQMLLESCRRVGYFVNRRRVEAELREEMEAHRAQMAEPHTFGNSLRLREESRDVWGWSWLDDIARDMRHALRTIGRMPVIATVIVVSMGVGIGVNTSVFSWVAAVALNPIPGIDDDSEIYLVEPRSAVGSYPGASWPEYHDLRDQLHAFSDLVAFRMTPLNVGPAERNERTYGLLVSDNYFSELGMKPQLGRLSTSERVARAGGEPQVVVSNGFWRSRFDGSPDVIGQQLEVNGQSLTITGVTPEGFFGTVLGLDFDLWVPATIAPLVLPGSGELDDRQQRSYSLIGHLRPGASMAIAQAELTMAMAELADRYPTSNESFDAEVLPFWRSPRGPQRMLLTAIMALQALTLLLLLAVCVNAANLLLARAATRNREIAIRMAMGAVPWHIVRLLATENLILALMGSGLGVTIALWGASALRAVPLPTRFPIRLDTSVDADGLLFTVGLGVFSALAIGVAPALQLVRSKQSVAPRPSATARPSTGLRNLVMGMETAVALAVLIVAGLFLQGFRDTQTIAPGFDSEGVLLASYNFPDSNVSDELLLSFADRVLERLQAQPDVEVAAIAASVPLDIHGLPLRSFDIEGRTRPDGLPDQALRNTVTPGYFATMGIPFAAGSAFSDFGSTPTQPEIVVNETFVRRYLGGVEPLGRRVVTGDVEQVIVGVVADSIYESFDEPAVPIIYQSFWTNPLWYAEIHLKTPSGTETLHGPALRAAVREIEPTLPLYDIRSLDQHIATNLFLERIPARMFALLGPLLLLLVAIGIYAVVAFSVSRRTREIGVRLALGARAGTITGQIVSESMKVILLGAGVGWLLVFIVQVHLSPSEPLDRLAFFGVPAFLAMISALACWLPAHRAAGIDPMDALRDE